MSIQFTIPHALQARVSDAITEAQAAIFVRRGELPPRDTLLSMARALIEGQERESGGRRPSTPSALAFFQEVLRDWLVEQMTTSDA